MKKLSIAFAILILASLAHADWVFGPEDFEDHVIFDHSGSYTSYWFAPTYYDPMFVYSPGFDSDSAVGSGAMSWPDWWGNFIRTPLTDCSSADSVVLSFRWWNTADPLDNDYARFYIWVEPPGEYRSTTVMSMGPGYARDWELMNIDFTDSAAGESQVFFYLEANFGTGSFTRECKFDDIGVATNTVLEIDEVVSLPEKPSLKAYPNPFNGNCRIVIDDLGMGIDAIEVFDLNGRMVESVTELVEVPGGIRENAPSTGSGSEFVWTPDPAIGSGVYLIRATTSQQTASAVCTERVVYLK